jgi:serine/threonine protein kinase
MEGLAYAHSKKIIHRDLKPSNVFLVIQHTMTKESDDEDAMINFSVKIGDFGFSKEMLDSCLKSDSGTFHYQSPQAINNRAYTFKTDVW